MASPNVEVVSVLFGGRKQKGSSQRSALWKWTCRICSAAFSLHLGLVALRVPGEGNGDDQGAAIEQWLDLEFST
jgi:hypothetical protein